MRFSTSFVAILFTGLTVLPRWGGAEAPDRSLSCAANKDCVLVATDCCGGVEAVHVSSREKRTFHPRELQPGVSECATVNCVSTGERSEAACEGGICRKRACCCPYRGPILGGDPGCEARDRNCERCQYQ